MRGRRARTTLEQLATQADAHAARRQRLAEAREAAVLAPHVDALRRAEDGVDAAVAARAKAASAGPGVSDHHLSALREQLAEHDELLTTGRHEAEMLIRLRGEVPLAASIVQERVADVESRGQALEAASERLAALRSAQEEITAAQERLEEISPELALAEQLMEARRSLGDLREKARESTDARQAAQQHALDLRASVQELVQDRLDNMAGELASQLVAGEACSVCGAREHPDPASAARQVTPEEIDEARAGAEAAEGVAADLRAADEALRARLEVTRAKVTELEAGLVPEGGAPQAQALATEELEHLVDGLRRERSALVEVTGRRDSVDTAARACERSISDAEAARTETETALSAARARQERVVEEIAAGTSRLVETLAAHDRGCPCPEAIESTSVLAGPRTLEALLEEAEAQHGLVQQRIEDMTSAADALEKARRMCQEAGERLVAALAESGFAGAEGATAAILDRAALADLEQQVDEHEHRLASATSVLAEEEIITALSGDPVDLEELRREAERTAHEKDLAGRRQASIQTVLRQFTLVRDHLHRACTELGPAAEEADLVTRMSALVSGTSSDNDKRMRLSTYVLAARLERIVELANERLLVMADGRYELAHHDAPGRSRRRGGLGLLVQDLWTGQDRPTDTLSGGESFTVSLALALGLADAIREESGGREFGILFVDEGFGSLDQDSLEQVLDMLDRLRDGGRTVGVVSHVAEMRTRIPTRIRVEKAPHGSSVHVSGVAGTDAA